MFVGVCERAWKAGCKLGPRPRAAWCTVTQLVPFIETPHPLGYPQSDFLTLRCAGSQARAHRTQLASAMEAISVICGRHSGVSLLAELPEMGCLGADLTFDRNPARHPSVFGTLFCGVARQCSAGASSPPGSPQLFHANPERPVELGKAIVQLPDQTLDTFDDRAGKIPASEGGLHCPSMPHHPLASLHGRIRGARNGRPPRLPSSNRRTRNKRQATEEHCTGWPADNSTRGPRCAENAY